MEYDLGLLQQRHQKLLKDAGEHIEFAKQILNKNQNDDTELRVKQDLF